MASVSCADNVTMSRHNLSRLTVSNVVLWQEGGVPQGSNYPIDMAGFIYDQFNEVCVYCHTPHGASTVAPLWNRVVNTSGNYSPYASSTIDTSVGQPGGVSLACLSCHDGTIAVDNIVNAPGSGGYNIAGKNPTPNGSHQSMAVGAGSTCSSCHMPGGGPGGAHDGTIKYLGLDLRGTHPISMTYPTLTGADPKFNPPDANGKFANGVKLYSGKVECPSCHNPHLGEADYATEPNLRPFLRVSNNQSGLCVTCHIK